MKIFFVRHGHPNYRLDRLTELGHRQAEAAAERLKDEGIEKIYASTCGRAMETACHTADRIGIPREDIVHCHFMREIRWGSRDGTELYQRGGPWSTADKMLREGESLLCPDLSEDPAFRNNTVTSYARSVCERGDIWLSFLGLRREGDHYRVTKENNSTIAMFSHAGSSSALIAHITGIPFSLFFTVFRPDFTAITVLEFEGEVGEIALPRIRHMLDARHIVGIEGEKTVPQF
jgi:probable phosphoglycerate mutase